MKRGRRRDWLGVVIPGIAMPRIRWELGFLSDFGGLLWSGFYLGLSLMFFQQVEAIENRVWVKCHHTPSELIDKELGVGILDIVFSWNCESKDTKTINMYWHIKELIAYAMEETTRTRVSWIDWMFGIVIIMKKNVWDSNNYEAVAKKKNVWAKDKANNPIEQTVISQ